MAFCPASCCRRNLVVSVLCKESCHLHEDLYQIIVSFESEAAGKDLPSSSTCSKSRCLRCCCIALLLRYALLLRCCCCVGPYCCVALPPTTVFNCLLSPAAVALLLHCPLPFRYPCRLDRGSGVQVLAPFPH